MRNRGERGPRESRLASGWTVEAGPDEAQIVSAGEAPPAPAAHGQAPTTEVAAHARPQLGSGMLVLLGIIGGLYLLYTAVWFSWAKYYSDVNSAVAEGSGAVGAVAQQLVFWAAPFAPALWFLSAVLLNRGAPARRMVFWLLIGAVVLVPLPMLDFGASS